MSDLVLYKSEWFNGMECDFWKNENGEIFMTGQQLGSILGYADPAKSIRKLVERHKNLNNSEFSSSVRMTYPSGCQETRVFTEDGIYEATLLSKTKKAEEFRAWVRKILKGLRKNELILLQKQLEDIQPKLEFYNQCISAENYMSMLQASKILKMSGRNKLYKFLRDEEILMTKGERYNLPYQQHIDSGHFAVVVKTILIGKKVVDVPVTLISAKGINYVQKILSKKKDLLKQVN